MSTVLKVPDTIVSFNAKVGRGGKAIIESTREILDDNPTTDVILFQEADGYVDDLRRAFSGPNKGWYVYAHKERREGQMNPVMVRKDPGFPKRTYGAGWGTVENKLNWTGPKHGLDHEGRTWTWVKVGRLYVMSLHRVTGGEHKNKEAYQEEARKLVKFMTARERRRHIVIFGDTNTAWKATHAGSMRDIRAQTQGRLIADSREPGIDYALTSESVNAIVRRTKNYGSDHKAAVMRRIEIA